MGKQHIKDRLDEIESNLGQMARVYKQVLDFANMTKSMNNRLDKLEKELEEWKKGIEKDG